MVNVANRSPSECTPVREDSMEQEAERADPAENIVRFVDVLRRRRSSSQDNQEMTERTVTPEDDKPPPDAA